MKYKKRWLILGIISLLVIGGYITINTYSKHHVKISFDETTDFSEKELQNGANVIIKHFNQPWNRSKLHSIHFDKVRYENETRVRDDGSSTSFSHLPKENVLIFETSFTTGKNIRGSLSPNMEMDGWMFILTRDNKDKKWKILDQGV